MDLIRKYNALKIKEIEAKRSIPSFKAGDTINVHVKIVDGTASRIQIVRGLCIARRNRSAGSTFIVRRVGQDNTAVERIFSLHTPNIVKIEVVRVGKVRRAKIYYIRKLRGKKARIKSTLVSSATGA